MPWRHENLSWRCNEKPALAPGRIRFCGPGGGGGNGTSTVTVGTPSGGLSFNPTSITVPLNGTVTWNWNSGGVAHDVTFQDGSTSGNKSTGSYQKSFPAAGTFS